MSGKDLKEELRTIILSGEFRYSDGEENVKETAETVDQLLELFNEREQAARLQENGWSRQQMIAAQLLEAPNSGFGRMVKWAIDLFNKRKAELLANKDKTSTVKAIVLPATERGQADPLDEDDYIYEE